MTRHAWIAAAVALALAPEGRAGSYTWDFSSLAADAGRVVPIASIRDGPFTLYVYDSLVIGPGDPGYSGQIGILPMSEYTSIRVIYEKDHAFRDVDVSATFSPAASGVLDWSASSGSGYWHWAWQGVLSSTTVLTFTPLPASDDWMGEVDLAAYSDSGVQLTALTIGTLDAPSVPEPSSVVLAGLGAAGVGLLGRRAVRRRGRATGHPGAS